MSKTVIITGAAGNLGKAAVDTFVQEGYRVVATISPGNQSRYPSGDSVEYKEADLTNESGCRELVNDVIKKYERIDAALLLVGGFAMGNIEQTDGVALKKMFALNFDTAYFVARPVFLQMQKQPGGGRIVLVGSRPSLDAKAGKNMVAYALSKSLLFKLAEYLNAEGSAHNIVTSVIVPSTIDTPENRKSMPNADFNKWVKPEDIAKHLAHLCSPGGSSLREPILKLYGDA
jgi:NAD(P)-dependent dehydrogenase (short-subunit alcohol dehydrogenase family)